MDSGAIISPCGEYRYKLWRIWDPCRGTALWGMLNPSTAGTEVNDQTIKRVFGFTIRLGLGGFFVVNFYAFRTWDPSRLKYAKDPIGPENVAYVKAELKAGHKLVIAAWGANLKPSGRLTEFTEMFREAKAMCFGKTANGQPRHPLMLRYDTPLELL